MEFDIFDCHHHVGDVRAFVPLTDDEDAPTEGDALAAERAARVRIMDGGGVAERVVVGTDLSSPPLGRRISHLVPQIIESALTDDEKTQVLGANARKLFGVT